MQKIGIVVEEKRWLIVVGMPKLVEEHRTSCRKNERN